MIDQRSEIKNQSQNQKSNPEVRYRAFYLSLNVIRLFEEIPSKTSLKVVGNQLIRSITSIGANIIEAKASSSRREFLNYFQIALKSVNESKYWLALLKELVPASRLEIEKYINETEKIGRIIGSSVLTLKGKRI